MYRPIKTFKCFHEIKSNEALDILKSFLLGSSLTMIVFFVLITLGEG
jgi:hypothetical protein